MHGIIFAELKKYVITKLGDQAWDNLLNESGIGTKIYLAFQTYPDQEAVALISTASKVTGESIPAILEDFGEFITPDLMAMYNHLIKPEWRTLDLIEHTEETIHHLVRIRQAGAQPPALHCSRADTDEVVITYSSPRKMCALAVGIAKGVAKHYNERITVKHTTCMLEGSSSCNISIKLT
ncbi:MAG TPA: heme NO-binding domain-containing protein [Blastocatellia bacterium]|jgi:hypothetical protein|nr:heme NO-binding domain-containing protein [Blastocatellia bacterium]